MLNSPATLPTENYSEGDEIEFKKLLQEYGAFRATFHPLADDNMVAAHFALQKLKEARS